VKYYIEAFRKYAVFSGRASRSEYWYFFLFNIIAQFVIGFGATFIAAVAGASSDSATNTGESLMALYVLAALLPSIAVSVRRLHDAGYSGWLLLLGFIPLAGIVLIVLFCTDSQPGTNKYGPNPKGATSADVVQEGSA